jgi:hypothetical protein
MNPQNFTICSKNYPIFLSVVIKGDRQKICQQLLGIFYKLTKLPYYAKTSRELS